MNWSRTVRVDALLDDAARAAIAENLARFGASVQFEGSSELGRTYALIEGSARVEPAQAQACVPGRWYDEAIIALAIEPSPADALPALKSALGGSGAPAGVLACETAQARLIVEIAPSKTQLSFVMQIVDVELRRFAGHRRSALLSPLPPSVVAAIAADGLQAPEIAPDRILESLLAQAYVE